MVVISVFLLFLTIIAFSFSYFFVSDNVSFVDANVGAPIELNVYVEGEKISGFPVKKTGYGFSHLDCKNDSIGKFDKETWSLDINYTGYDVCDVYFVIVPHLTGDLVKNGLDLEQTTNYTTSVSCDGGEIVWDNYIGGLVVNSLNYDTVCTVTYSPIDDLQSLNDYVISLNGTESGTGEVVLENGYRYQGKNPNNYIWYNNDLWRIVGVFETELSDGSTDNLTKIVKNEAIGAYAWENYDSNNWESADLKNILDNYYYNQTDGTDTHFCSGYGFDSKADCDFTVSGLNTLSRSMVETVVWHLGGHDTNGSPVDVFYDAERGTSVYGSMPTEWTGNVALIYPSDYGYSTLATECDRTTNLDRFTSNGCTIDSWMYCFGHFWYLTPNSSNGKYVFYSSSDGDLTDGYNLNSYHV